MGTAWTPASPPRNAPCWHLRSPRNPAVQCCPPGTSCATSDCGKPIQNGHGVAPSSSPRTGPAHTAAAGANVAVQCCPPGTPCATSDCGKPVQNGAQGGSLVFAENRPRTRRCGLRERRCPVLSTRRIFSQKAFQEPCPVSGFGWCWGCPVLSTRNALRDKRLREACPEWGAGWLPRLCREPAPHAPPLPAQALLSSAVHLENPLAEGVPGRLSSFGPWRALPPRAGRWQLQCHRRPPRLPRWPPGLPPLCGTGPPGAPGCHGSCGVNGCKGQQDEGLEWLALSWREVFGGPGGVPFLET